MKEMIEVAKAFMFMFVGAAIAHGYNYIAWQKYYEGLRGRRQQNREQ
ncbi:MAG: hypothetical protein IKM02_05485 [Clostridia bacterium]|nr:hypothetical protein [Clostridia bacterium]